MPPPGFFFFLSPFFHHEVDSFSPLCRLPQWAASSVTFKTTGTSDHEWESPKIWDEELLSASQLSEVIWYLQKVGQHPCRLCIFIIRTHVFLSEYAISPDSVPLKGSSVTIWGRLLSSLLRQSQLHLFLQKFLWVWVMSRQGPWSQINKGSN